MGKVLSSDPRQEFLLRVCRQGFFFFCPAKFSFCATFPSIQIIQPACLSIFIIRAWRKRNNLTLQLFLIYPDCLASWECTAQFCSRFVKGALDSCSLCTNTKYNRHFFPLTNLLQLCFLSQNERGDQKWQLWTLIQNASRHGFNQVTFIQSQDVAITRKGPTIFATQ